VARALGGAGTEVTLLPEQTRALDYLARKGTNAPIATLRSQLREAFAAIETAFDAVPSENRDRAPQPGKWSPREILDHLVLSHGPAIPQLESLLAGAGVPRGSSEVPRSSSEFLGKTREPEEPRGTPRNPEEPMSPIPAGLHRPDDERPPWDALRVELGDIHRRFVALVDGATDAHSLDVKAPIVMVVKAGGKPLEWVDHFDWKAVVQAIRMHTLEHHEQLKRTGTPC
jgi:DinB superfamily